MNCHTSATSALKCIGHWFGALPLLSEELLFRALPAKTGDYPELPSTILAELFMRRWLYPQPPESNREWLDKLNLYLRPSQFADHYAAWTASQATKRTYEIPENVLDFARDELEIALVHELRDGFQKWDSAHGTIAFLSQGLTPSEDQRNDKPPVADVLLPFRLDDHNHHDPAADFGKRSAILAAVETKRGWVDHSKLFIHFPTMSKRLPGWMGGESGSLAIWFAYCANQCALPRKALDVGLAGCCSQDGQLRHWDNPSQIVRRKRDLFRRAHVPEIVLPGTMENKDPAAVSCILWPLNTPLGSLMDDLLNRQMSLHPDTRKLEHIESCLIWGEDDICIEDAHRTLVEMEDAKKCSSESARHINFLAYICCCRMQREPEATARERRILEMPRSEIGDMPLELRAARSETASQRLEKLASVLKKKVSENVPNPTLTPTRT